MSTAPATAAGVELFRHTLAALACRAGKAVRSAPAEFAGDLMDWTLSILKGTQAWKDSRPIEWDEEVR
jgi:hypothetical protein